MKNLIVKDQLLLNMLVQRGNLVKALIIELNSYLKDDEAVSKLEQQIQNIDNLLIKLYD
jgi:hypothetical protein